MKLRTGICAFVVLLFAAAAVSCSRDGYKPMPEPEQLRKVFILYACGYNNLAPYIYDNMEELFENLPSGKVDRFYKVLIFSHLTKDSPYFRGTRRDDSDFKTPCSPVLIDAYTDEFGEVVLDTLIVFPENTVSASASTMKDVLSYIHEKFPAEEYGMVVSSHGTGWLPNGYYSVDDGDREEREPLFLSAAPASAGIVPDIPHSSYIGAQDGPLVKTLTAQYYGYGEVEDSHEMEICDFAAAIPFRLKYLVLDLCLGGGVELAYELEGKVDFMISSQTEVLASGFNYDTMLDRLLYSDEADLVGVCDDYYHKYADTGSYAVVSLVDCGRMKRLAAVCSTLFSSRALVFETMKRSSVQRYFRFNKHWFYDLKDILVQSGISEEEENALDEALGECVIFKAATKRFIDFPIERHCGLSMYLPKMKYVYLNSFYRDFRWNKATALVR